MTNAFLNAENIISDVYFCILCNWTESENVNFIKISRDIFFFFWQ